MRLSRMKELIYDNIKFIQYTFTQNLNGTFNATNLMKMRFAAKNLLGVAALENNSRVLIGILPIGKVRGQLVVSASVYKTILAHSKRLSPKIAES